MKRDRLLWVDDEISLLRPHILFLEGKGYEVDTVTNGQDALDRCRATTYDLIFLDENMPGLSGLQTLALIKEICPTVPVVMITKSEEENIMDMAIGQKIADYLIKPVNPNQILLSLKKNLHRRDIVSEAAQTGYQQNFGKIGMQINDSLTATDWMELYRRPGILGTGIGSYRQSHERDACHAESRGQFCLCQIHKEKLYQLGIRRKRGN